MRKFLSAPYWIHLLVDTVIGQAIWWVISMVIGTPILERSIIAGVILIAVIFAVACTYRNSALVLQEVM